MVSLNFYPKDIASPLAVQFDRDADVLYFSAGWDGPIEGAGLPDGVELDFRTETHEPCGVTVIGVHAYDWNLRLDELAEIVAKHLTLPRERVLAELTMVLVG